MIDRQKGKIVFECDTCDAVLVTNESEFEDARGKFKEEGWRAYIEEEATETKPAKWAHSCGCV